MLDQMFTAENFRRIYDAENRKGADLATRYFPSLEPLTLAVRDKVKDIRDLRKVEAKLTVENFETQLLALKTELVTLKAAKSSAIDDLMGDINQKVQTIAVTLPELVWQGWLLARRRSTLWL